MPVAYYSRKLTKSKQNTFKLHGRIFLEDNNVRFHHIKDEPNTLTDARSVSPLMRGRTPWRRLRQQHLLQIFSIFSFIFTFNRYYHKFAMKQMQIAKQFKYLTIQAYKLLLQYIHH
jgi:hypothetical protein